VWEASVALSCVVVLEGVQVRRKEECGEREREVENLFSQMQDAERSLAGRSGSEREKDAKMPRQPELPSDY